MRQPFFILVFLFAFFASNAQDSSARQTYVSKDFGWRITIPPGFTTVSAEEWNAMQQKGADAIEKTVGEKVVNQAKTLAVFRSNDLNYFEANWQPFNPKEQGSYAKSFKEVNDLLYLTFQSQMPGATLDSVYFREAVGGLNFHVFKVKIGFPNKMVMNAWMYSRPFGSREFSVNIMTTDRTKEGLLLDAWRASVFSVK